MMDYVLNNFLMMLFYNIHVISVKLLSNIQLFFSDLEQQLCFDAHKKKNAL